MIDDDGLLRRRFSNKKVNASKENIGFYLSFEEIVLLLNEANIKSSDWTIKGYHLARYGDKGPYKYGNCRFIPYYENFEERQAQPFTEKQYENSRKSVVIASKALTPEILSNAGKKGAASVNIVRKEQSDRARKELIKKVLKANIDVKKYGWVGKAAKHCKVSHTEIRRAFEMFYEGETHKRKTEVGSLVDH